MRVLAERAAAHRHDWLRPEICVPDAEQGFGICVLHEEADHQLAVFVASWLPGRGTPPHDHGTWAVVAGLEGTERNSFWKRLDDRSRPGYAETVMVGERTFGPATYWSCRPARSTAYGTMVTASQCRCTSTGGM